MLTKEQLCQKFLENPKINPKTGAGLKRGFKPFAGYVDLCRELGYNDEVDILLGLKEESTTTSTSTMKQRSPSSFRREIKERNLEDPIEIVVGDVGTYTTGGKYGRTYWNGFVVTEIINPGKKIKVQFDMPFLVGKEEMAYIELSNGSRHYFFPETSKIRILEYRRPGRWMFKGVTAKDTSGDISFGEKKTGAEEGIF